MKQRYLYYCAALDLGFGRLVTGSGVAVKPWRRFIPDLPLLLPLPHLLAPERPTSLLHGIPIRRHAILLDAVHRIRQAVGLACGLLWGVVSLVGVFWIARCIYSWIGC